MKKILFSVLLLLVSLFTSAQWSGDPAVGTPVSTGAATLSKSDIVSVSDGAGGAYIAWIETQSATASKIFIQRLSVDGARLFGSDVVVSESSGSVSAVKQNLYMATDDAGGVICVWQDYRFRTSTSSARDEIYGQRISPAGVRLWDTAGVRMTAADVTISSKISPIVTMVNATEAIVIFGDNRNGTSDLFAQKINIATGATQWTDGVNPADVSLHGSQLGTSTFQTILPDGSGGAFVVWQDPRTTGNADIYGQRVSNSGVLLWGPSGNPIANTVGNQSQPSAVSDDAGGLVVTYQDFLVAGGTNPSIFAQRVNSAGVKQWNVGATPQEGVAVCVAPLIQSNPYIVKSSANFIIAWADQRLGTSGVRDIYAQSLDASGALQWPSTSMPAADGINVVNASGNQPSSSTQSGYQIVSDNNGGAIIVWDDARGADLNNYAQRISGSGVLLWPTVNGVPVSTAAANQQTPVVVPSLGSSVIVAWRDGRSGTANGEIYAARLQSTGVLPVRSITVNATAKANTIDVKWSTLDETNTATFVVEKSTDGNNFYSAGSVKAKGQGNGNYQLVDTRPVEGINYFRIKSIDINRSYNYSSVIAVSFGNDAKPFVLVYPNPVVNVMSLQTANLAKGNYQVFVRDMTGRIYLQKTLTVAAGYQVQTIGLSNLASGTYVLQLVHDGENSINTVFQKQ